MKKFRFIVPIRGVVSMEVEAKDVEQAKENLLKGKGIEEGSPEIDTWYTEKAYLEED